MSTEIDILDAELEDHKNPVATIRDDGAVEGYDEGMAEEDIEKVLGPNHEVPYRDARKVTDEDGEQMTEEHLHWIEPGDPGYLIAVVEALPWPYKADWDSVELEALTEPEVTYDGE